MCTACHVLAILAAVIVASIFVSAAAVALVWLAFRDAERGSW